MMVMSARIRAIVGIGGGCLSGAVLGGLSDFPVPVILLCVLGGGVTAAVNPFLGYVFGGMAVGAIVVATLKAYELPLGWAFGAVAVIIAIMLSTYAYWRSKVSMQPPQGEGIEIGRCHMWTRQASVPSVIAGLAWLAVLLYYVGGFSVVRLVMPLMLCVSIIVVMCVLYAYHRG